MIEEGVKALLSSGRSVYEVDVISNSTGGVYAIEFDDESVKYSNID